MARLYGETESSVGSEAAAFAAAAPSASLCFCVLSFFFCHVVLLSRQDIAKRIMGKGNIGPVRNFDSSLIGLSQDVTFQT